MRGYLWALASVVLVSIAQLVMKDAMVQLPPWQDIPVLLAWLFSFKAGVLGLGLGILGYGCSMVCWSMALHRIPLGKAYALLSLSYVLVWLAAGLWSPASFIGVGLIVAGVLVIFLPPAQRR